MLFRSDSDKELSEEWIGTTMFDLVKPPPLEDYTWSANRLVRKQTTNRPDFIDPTLWSGWSKSKRKKEVRLWEPFREVRDKARAERGIMYISEAEVKTWRETLEAAKKALSPKAAPAMPCVQVACPGVVSPSPHQDNVAPAGYCSDEWFACVHLPIKIEVAKGIPEASAALNAEFKKLEDKRTWDMSTVKERDDVIRDRKSTRLNSSHSQQSRMPSSA